MTTIGRMREIAEELLADCEITRPPVPISRIAATTGAFLLLDTNMPERVDGVLAVDANAALIRVNASRSLNRQRWSIAHEVGHFYLHAGHDTAGTYMLSVHQRRTREEREASRFAAEVLMPERWFRREWEQCPLVDAMGHLFAVSEEAVKLRIRELGLRGPGTPRADEGGLSLGTGDGATLASRDRHTGSTAPHRAVLRPGRRCR